MNLLEMFPPHILLVFVVAFINNVALTSPQKNAAKGPPNYRAVPSTSFSCRGRTAGYYADPEAECQAYHMCDTLEKKYSYLCPSYTLFNQKYMVCDHWHAVNCSAAIHYYDLNKKIGQVPEKKSVEDNFIEDKEQHTSRKFPTAVSKDQIQNKIHTSTNKPDLFQFTQNTFHKTSISTSHIRTTTQKPITILPAQFRQPQQTFTLRRNSKISHSSTKSSLHLKTTTESSRLLSKIITAKHPTLPTTTPPHTFSQLFLGAHEPAIISNSLHEHNNRFPINARGSGQKLKFGHGHNDDLSDTCINGIKFKPLFKKPKKNFIDKRNFTVPPDILTSTIVPIVIEEDEDDDVSENDDNKNTVIARSLPMEQISFLVPPTIESLNDRLLQIENPKFPSLIPFLVPPPRGPIILEGDNQEIRTPLVVSQFRPFSFKRFGLIPPQSEIKSPRFPFSRSNKEFFIPAPGLLPPLPDNSISKDIQHSEKEDNIPHKMTMTFPNHTIMNRRRPLRINPNCPRCHPAFLKPNECQPCVIIK